MKLTTEPLYTDKSRDDIMQYGGKLGSLEYLRKYVPELRDDILPTGFLFPGDDDWEKACKFVQDKGLFGIRKHPKDGYIVRGSHPNDFYGLVDILPTKVVENYCGSAM